MSTDGIKIELDKERHLRFDSNAIADIEESTGWDLEQISKRLQANPSIKLVRACVWAGLRAEDPTLNLQQAGRLLNASNLKDVWPKVIEALHGALAGEAAAIPFVDQGKPN